MSKVSKQFLIICINFRFNEVPENCDDGWGVDICRVNHWLVKRLPTCEVLRDRSSSKRLTINSEVQRIGGSLESVSNFGLESSLSLEVNKAGCIVLLG